MITSSFSFVTGVIVTTGAVSSITRVAAVGEVLVFHAASVKVTVLFVPSSNQSVEVAVQFTVQLASAGLGLQTIHGTVIIAHSSTKTNGRVTVSQLCAGFGDRIPTIGLAGATLS